MKNLGDEWIQLDEEDTMKMVPFPEVSGGVVEDGVRDG
jgi:hypothetical protein